MGGNRKKQFLFVDDDYAFLESIKELFEEMADGEWQVFIAQTHAQALELLQRERVEVVVLDIGMPVMDGFQFLRLLSKAHPGQQAVMLTGQATDEGRKASLENGACLLLEKPRTASGFREIYAALDALAIARPQSGFRGMMRQVGLQEVLQMECLGRKSSVLEIFTEKIRGRIYICDGSIVHAESGPLQGEAALYGLLALRGGEFNLQPFVEPAQRTIAGPWEFLLMEAARLNDENTSFFAAPTISDEQQSVAATTEETSLPPATNSESGTKFTERANIRIKEIVLCSGSGEVLYDWQVKQLQARLNLLSQIERQASELSILVQAGVFDRVEIQTTEGRVVCQVRADRRLFVHSQREQSESE